MKKILLFGKSLLQDLYRIFLFISTGIILTCFYLLALNLQPEIVGNLDLFLLILCFSVLYYILGDFINE